MSGKSVVAVLSLLIFLVCVPLSFFYDTTGFIPELFIFMALSLFFWWSFDVWNLTVPVYTLLVLGFLSHSLGIFGWYNVSPLPVQWDHVTHFTSMFAFSLLFFGWVRQWMDSRLFTLRNGILLISVFLLVSGVGAVIELSEFLGYLKLGFGEGAFRFGPGDGTDGVITELGGGWINTGWDLVYNSLGAFCGIFCMLIVRSLRRSPESAYYFEEAGRYSKRIS